MMWNLWIVFNTGVFPEVTVGCHKPRPRPHPKYGLRNSYVWMKAGV